MKKIRLWLRNISGISKTESNGFAIFLPLIILIILTPSFIKHLTFSEVDLKEEEQALNDLVASLQIDSVGISTSKYIQPEYIYFDPNTVTADELKSMGLNKYTIKTWQNYLKSGAKFKTADEVSKIYGLSDTTFQQIRNFIKIKNEISTEKLFSNSKNKKDVFNKKKLPKKREYHPLQAFDLNTADTTQLKEIKGIGSAYSFRIVKYRDLLGGFAHKRQLKEVYGLSDTLLHRIDSLTFISPGYALKYLEINTASNKELGRHPYISTKQSRAIISYRHQHGPFKQLEDLQKIHILDSLTITKISPYLKF